MSAESKEGRDPDSGNTARGDDVPPEDDKTVETDPSSKSDPELIRGKVLGDKYEILSHLGSGAMGAVYKARHQILNKDVAVKVLQAEAVNDKVKKERFLREAKAQGGLTHRNIAAVHDFGITENDQPFFVMDFLEGQTLEERLEKEKSLDCHEFIVIFEQVARGLQHAHSKGIIHRDLKPSNIMLINSEDGETHALLVDFGIAVHSEKDLTKLTKAGFVIGTPHYMSPEQIEGKTLNVRADIYSLGCMMFEALTGDPPFAGINAAATMAMHLAQPPQHVTTFPTKTPLPEGLADVVMKCIEKRQEDRIATAKEISARLNDLKSALAKGAKTEEKPIKQSASDVATTGAGAGAESATAGSGAEAAGAGAATSGPGATGAGKGHHQNPAHAPAADPAVVHHTPVEEKSKVADKIELKAESTTGDSDSKDDSGSQSQLIDEAARLKAKVDGQTNRPNEKDSLDSAESQVSDEKSTDASSANSKSSDAKSPEDQAYNQAYNKFVDNLQQKEKKEPIDFKIYGHDIIRLVVIIIAGVIFLPLNNHLVIPNTDMMREDGVFFQLAKFLVQTYNAFAGHAGWQWVVWIGIIALCDSVMRKLLKSSPD